MWVWREETARGGWRLDAYGSWTWDEPARLAPVGALRAVGYDRSREQRLHEEQVREQHVREVRLREARLQERRLQERRADEDRARERFAAEQRARAERLRPAMSRLDDGFEPTPIFRSVAHREYRDDPRAAPVEYPHIPAPHPGSGPFPAQGGRRLASVDAVPPPPVEAAVPGPSPEDELRRRAERRRRPRAEADGGRHVLRR